MEPDVSIDVPVTADQATLLLADLGEIITHAVRVGEHVLPGQWRVYAVRADYIAGVRQHFARLEWLGVVA